MLEGADDRGDLLRVFHLVLQLVLYPLQFFFQRLQRQIAVRDFPEGLQQAQRCLRVVRGRNVVRYVGGQPDRLEPVAVQLLLRLQRGRARDDHPGVPGVEVLDQRGIRSVRGDHQRPGVRHRHRR